MNTSKLQEKIMPVVNKITSNVYLKAISDGLASIMPAIIVGAIFTLLASLPIPAYQNFLSSIGIGPLLQLPVTFTTNILAVYSVFFIAYQLSKNFDCDGGVAGLLALLCFFIVTPVATVDKTSYISFQWLGATGLFVAIIVGLVVARLYVAIVKKGMIIKMPNGVPPTISKSFAGLIPAFIITPIFIIVSAIFANTPFQSIHGFIYKFLQLPLEGLGGTLGALLIVMLVAHILWLFGIHGMMVTLSIMMPIYMALDMANLQAYNAGEPLPNIIGMAFIMTYVLVGGSGTTMGLNLWMSFRGKSKRYKTLGNIALPGGICGINEPIIFGTPVIMNPRLAIPFILTPLISTIVAYFATAIGLVPKLMGAQLPLGTPLIFGAFLQGGWRIAVLQVVIIAISWIVYLPFIKGLDNEAYKLESQETEDDEDFSGIEI
jgi:cellobiose PTS system EIIC component